MNLVRLIKLHKVFGELDNLSDDEKLFISMFDSLKLDDEFYYSTLDGKRHFRYYENTNVFWYSYDNVGWFIQSVYGYNVGLVDKMIYRILHNKLKIKNVSIISS